MTNKQNATDYETTLALIEALEPGRDLADIHVEFDPAILAAAQRTGDALTAHQTAVTQLRKLIDALTDRGYAGF